jgi:hypothetical protein
VRARNVVAVVAVPPSTMTSSGSISSASWSTTSPVMAAGIITQAARGLSSARTKPSKVVVPVAPSRSSSATASGAGVVDHAVVAVTHQAPDDAGAHPAEADHSTLRHR